MIATIVRSMGFDTNDEKNVAPPTRGTFLGGGLDTDTEETVRCSKYIDEDRRAYVMTQCLELEHTPGMVRVGRLSSVLGILSFCAYLVDDMKLFLRSGFDLIGNKEPGAWVKLTRNFRFDLAHIRKLLKQVSPHTLLTRRPLTTGFGSWDSSTHWGMGGFSGRKVFRSVMGGSLENEGSETLLPEIRR